MTENSTNPGFTLAKGSSEAVNVQAEADRHLQAQAAEQAYVGFWGDTWGSFVNTFKWQANEAIKLPSHIAGTNVGEFKLSQVDDPSTSWSARAADLIGKTGAIALEIGVASRAPDIFRVSLGKTGSAFEIIGTEQTALQRFAGNLSAPETASPQVADNAITHETRLAASTHGTSLVPWINNFERPNFSNERVANEFVGRFSTFFDTWRYKNPPAPDRMILFKCINERVANDDAFIRAAKMQGVDVDWHQKGSVPWGMRSEEWVELQIENHPKLIELNQLRKKNKVEINRRWDEAKFAYLKEYEMQMQSFLDHFLAAQSLPSPRFSFRLLGDLGGNLGGQLDLNECLTDANGGRLHEAPRVLGHELTHAEQEALMLRYLAQKLNLTSESAPEAFEELMIDFRSHFTQEMQAGDFTNVPYYARAALQAVKDRPLTPGEVLRALRCLNAQENYPDYRNYFRDHLKNFNEQEAWALHESFDDIVCQRFPWLFEGDPSARRANYFLSKVKRIDVLNFDDDEY